MPIDTGEQWLLDPNASMIAGDLQPSKLVGPIYELSAVVTHAGRHENGHYICYRKFPKQKASGSPDTGEGDADENGDVNDVAPQEEDTGEPEESQGKSRAEMEWWRLSDHNVTMVDEETISSLSPGVFMLFYDCVDPSMVLQPEDEPVDAPTVNGVHANEQEEPQDDRVDEGEVDAQLDGATMEDASSSFVSVTEVDSASSLASTTVVGSDEDSK